jgi:hypothetical protein
LLFLDAIATTAKAKNSSSGYRPPGRYSHVLYPQILLQTREIHGRPSISCPSAINFNHRWLQMDFSCRLPGNSFVDHRQLQSRWMEAAAVWIARMEPAPGGNLV